MAPIKVPLTTAERSRRHKQKLKSEGNYKAYKTKHNLDAKKNIDKKKRELEDLPLPTYLKKYDEVRQKIRNRVRKHRQQKKTPIDSTHSLSVFHESLVSNCDKGNKISVLHNCHNQENGEDVLDKPNNILVKSTSVHVVGETRPPEESFKTRKVVRGLLQNKKNPIDSTHSLRSSKQLSHESVFSVTGDRVNNQENGQDVSDKPNNLPVNSTSVHVVEETRQPEECFKTRKVERGLLQNKKNPIDSTHSLRSSKQLSHESVFSVTGDKNNNQENGQDVSDKPNNIPVNSTSVHVFEETRQPEECLKTRKVVRGLLQNKKNPIDSTHSLRSSKFEKIPVNSASERDIPPVECANMIEYAGKLNNFSEKMRTKHDEVLNRAGNPINRSVRRTTPCSQRNSTRLIREKIRNRVRKCRLIKLAAKKGSDEPAIYPTNSALRKAVSRATQALPKCPRKRKTVVMKLYEKYVEPPKIAKVKIPRNSGLSTQVKESVVAFYERSDISRQSPGRKDFIKIVDENGDKTTVQLKHLMYPIRHVYFKFCKEVKSIPLGVSKFFELRPKHVVSINKMPHSVCLCQYHENFMFAINAINKIAPEMPKYGGETTDDFYATFFCENMTKECWFGDCKSCKDIFRDTILGISESLSENRIKWNVWQEVEGRWQKVLHTGSGIKLGNHILDIAPKFFQHCFVKREQAKRYQEQIDFGDESVAVIQLDFSENYTCVAQNEIQKGHYNQRQLSILTAVIWISNRVQSYAIVSNNLDHTKRTIVPYLDRLIEELPDNIKTVHVWSDGPSSQFKNKFIAASIPVLENNRYASLEWNFFATSHGKGPVDGIGGALKRQVWSSVLARIREVRDAAEFKEAVDKNSKIKVILMDKVDTEERIASLNLEEEWNKAPDIRGIFNFHCLRNVGGKVVGKLISKEFA